jgi:hypothetical protein
MFKEDIIQKWTNSDSLRIFSFEVPYRLAIYPYPSAQHGESTVRRGIPHTIS